jgi:hypothetical protein
VANFARSSTTAVAGVIAAAVVYLAVGVAAWCMEGAYNVLQGDPPARLFAASLALAGLMPFVAAWFGFRVQRRSGQSVVSSLMFTSVVTLGVTIFVGFFRAGAGGGF